MYFEVSVGCTLSMCARYDDQILYHLHINNSSFIVAVQLSELCYHRQFNVCNDNGLGNVFTYAKHCTRNVVNVIMSV